MIFWQQNTTTKLVMKNILRQKQNNWRNDRNGNINYCKQKKSYQQQQLLSIFVFLFLIKIKMISFSRSSA
jgi:hypothetical protein